LVASGDLFLQSGILSARQLVSVDVLKLERMEIDQDDIIACGTYYFPDWQRTRHRSSSNRELDQRARNKSVFRVR
jgi:hypothetical protein